MARATTSASRRADPVGWSAQAVFATVVAFTITGCSSMPDAPQESTILAKAEAPVQPRPQWETPALRPNALQPNALRTNRGIARRPRASSFAGVAKFPEAPYTNAELRRNFLSIAMRAEAADDVDRSGNIAIAKWITPLRYTLVGARPADAARVAALSTRLRFLTGMDIAQATAERPNMRLSFVPFRFRGRSVAQLAGSGSLGPTVGGMVARWRDTEREKCLGLISVNPGSGAIAGAEILIKDELPPQIRDACIVEEIVQSLGLMNDDSRARPSIFNDSQEYLDLTSHDEYLLRILYDPRVRPGMTRRQMDPLVNQIIREVRPVVPQPVAQRVTL